MQTGLFLWSGVFALFSFLRVEQAEAFCPEDDDQAEYAEQHKAPEYRNDRAIILVRNGAADKGRHGG